MKMNWPMNFKEDVIMALPNCSVMVVGMMTLNMWIYGALTLTNWLTTLPFIFVTAFCLDFCCIGRLTGKIASRYHIEKFQPLYRVFLMVAILTFVAPIIESWGHHIVSGGQYLMALPRNYIAALLLQVFVAMPFGSMVLGRYRRMFAVVTAARR